ncbi:hypothetical protein [Cupriavidus oxalaticus]|jgi:hypothetical protein|uniref:hypothetical protein n=1 Tax=Cupriavidus oxalaticus TaxID=96344 RepID=UPI0040338A64
MTIETYRRYRRLLKTIPFKGKYAPYGWGELPQTLCIAWLPYSQMFDEFSRELANALNGLANYTHQLAAWRDLLAPMDQQRQLDAAVDFIDPVATVALNLPYVIRSRFIFASAHLCHQANHAKQGATWKDEFPLDGEVWFDAADKYGKPWKRYSTFKARLEKVGAKDYQTATHDFRNAYNHRFSPRIVIGISNLVTRRVNKATGSVSYGFGETPALTLLRVVELLETQCDRAHRAFESFQQLVREHEAAIRGDNTASLASIEKASGRTSGV